MTEPEAGEVVAGGDGAGFDAATRMDSNSFPTLSGFQSNSGCFLTNLAALEKSPLCTRLWNSSALLLNDSVTDRLFFRRGDRLPQVYDLAETRDGTELPPDQAKKGPAQDKHRSTDAKVVVVNRRCNFIFLCRKALCEQNIFSRMKKTTAMAGFSLFPSVSIIGGC